MASRDKAIRYLGQITTTATPQTISTTSTGATSMNDLTEISQKYRYMDLLVNIATLPSGSATISVQEYFSDVGWVETGNSGVKTGTGKFFIMRDTASRTGDVGGQGAMGYGEFKQIVVTLTGSPTAATIQTYGLFHN